MELEQVKPTTVLLEQLIDKCGLTTVVSLIASVCYDKASSVPHNGNDDPSRIADMWSADGAKLNQVANELVNS